MKTAIAVAVILVVLGALLIIAAGFLDKRRADDLLVIFVALVGVGFVIIGMPTALLIAALLAWLPWT